MWINIAKSSELISFFLQFSKKKVFHNADYFLKIFGKLPETISMSEPFAFFNVHQLYCQNKITKEKYLKLLKSCVKLQYKPTIQRNTER